MLANEVACDLDGIARKEGPGQELHRGHIMHLPTTGDLE